jgi:parallel beta-helix repeat protein
MSKPNRRSFVYIVILFLAIIFIINGCNSVFPPIPGGNTYLIISTAGLGGTISPFGETSVAEGSNKTYLISPEEDYDIYDVQVDGESLGALEQYTFTNIQKNHTIVANFSAKPTSPIYVNPQKYQITATSTAGGTIQPEGTFNVIKGGDQIFAMIADPGHEIVDVLVDGISVGAVPYYIFDNVKDNHTIEAIFIQMFSLTMAVSGEGSTTPSVGIHVYPAGTVVDIEAHPSSGCFSFTGWSNSVTGTVNPTVVTIDSDKHVTATFQLGFKKIYNSTTGNAYDTIQEAINEGNDWEVIHVCPGIYYENIEFNGKSVTVKSANPSDPSIVASTIIDGSGSNTVAVVKFINGDASCLEGFTIRNGSGIDGGGIYVDESSPWIIRNMIKGNTGSNGGGGIYLYKSSGHIIENTITNNNTSNQGGGIFVTTDSYATILNNIISDNTASDKGGGIMVYDSSSPIIFGNTIINNKSYSIGMGGGGICVDGGNPTIKENNIIGNIAAKSGGGIHTSYCDSVISDNNIIGNSATSKGGGLYLSYGSPEVLRNKILDNEVIEAGGGIGIVESGAVISDNTIQGNKSDSAGGGISASEDSSPYISFNIIKNNDAPNGGGINLFESTAVVYTNTIVDNTGVYGAGMFVFNCFPRVTLNEFYDNMATNEGGGIFVSTSGDLLPSDARTTGWGYDDPTGYRLNIPNSFLDPPVGEEYEIADNKFLGNKHEFSSPNYSYSEGAHVYFDK